MGSCQKYVPARLNDLRDIHEHDLFDGSATAFLFRSFEIVGWNYNLLPTLPFLELPDEGVEKGSQTLTFRV